jgi:hypothetical protein
MLLAAMLAMVLAAAAPSLAQTAVGGDATILQYSCNQIQAAVETQYQRGEGTGAAAGAAEALGIDQQQVLACFGTAAAAQDVAVNINTAAPGPDGATPPAAVDGQLPPTGGASLIALGAGALLVGGGLLARRIVR